MFSAFGLALEVLHGFKVPAYVDAGSETRRLMWTLAHAHGTLMGLLHIGFAASLVAVPALDAAQQRVASRALLGATVLLPGGFFLGGIPFYAGDPGIGVAVVPIGATLLLVAIWQIMQAVVRSTCVQGGQNRAAVDSPRMRT